MCLVSQYSLGSLEVGECLEDESVELSVVVDDLEWDGLGAAGVGGVRLEAEVVVAHVGKALVLVPQGLQRETLIKGHDCIT